MRLPTFQMKFTHLPNEVFGAFEGCSETRCRLGPFGVVFSAHGSLFRLRRAENVTIRYPQTQS